ncbi:reverse transcriptase ribonuclease h [Moniliophthora roreri MCA 2997]|uniref:Reverse transcriptase ribonuclease h n=1 Tax=Moniliophthora roreri (strain MCA 2997) TaxID=1381753 RepID=V2W3M4_MONRO|nr:reverse transcriptase ribonuclease h [Moniliophthora roreri MCA 2997]
MSKTFPIITHLKPEEWLATLSTLSLLKHYSDVPAGLRKGFHISITNYYLPHTFIPNNHFTTEAEASIIYAKFSQKVELGCLSPPYNSTTLERLIRPFHTAPLAVVKQKPGKFHIVINHSFLKPPPSYNFTLPTPTTSMPMIPETTFINSVIDSDEFPC